MRDKSYNSKFPSLPPIEENGWIVDENAYVPIGCLTDPAPKAVLELTKCRCTTGSKSLVFTCYKMVFPVLLFSNAIYLYVKI